MTASFSFLTQTLFISFSHLIALAGTSSTEWEWSPWTPLSCSSLEAMHAWVSLTGVIMDSLSYTDCIPPVPSFFKTLTQRDFEFCHSLFCTSLDVHVICTRVPLWNTYIYGYTYIEPSTAKSTKGQEPTHNFNSECWWLQFSNQKTQTTSLD